MNNKKDIKLASIIEDLKIPNMTEINNDEFNKTLNLICSVSIESQIEIMKEVITSKLKENEFLTLDMELYIKYLMFIHCTIHSDESLENKLAMLLRLDKQVDMELEEIKNGNSKKYVK